MGSTVQELEELLELEGYTRGTALFDRELRARKVSMCQLRQGVSACESCVQFDGCSLVQLYMRDRVLG